MSLFPRLLHAVTGKWLPLLVFLSSYTVTTAIGAAYFMSASGSMSFRGYLQVPDTVLGSIGSPAYVAVLFLPYIFVPLGALIGSKAVQVIAPRIAPMSRFSEPTVSRIALYGLLFAAAAYSLLRLYQTDALIPTTADYQTNILRRTELYEQLGSVFFLIAYGTIPILCTVFLVNFEKSGRRAVDLIGFLLSMILFYYVIFVTYSKSHFLVFSLMLTLAVLISRASLWYIPAIAIASVSAFMFMWVLIDGKTIRISPPHTTVAEDRAEQGGMTKSRDPVAPKSTGVTEPLRAEDPVVRPNFFDGTVRPILFRMAASFPFYLSIFKEPGERCGIEAHTVRHVLHLPPSNCVLPIKVHAVMYPEINWVTGYAPASAPVSAYGELGLTWSVIVMAASGLLLGTLGSVVQFGRGPLMVAFGVATCTLAYYLSQLPIVAALTYGHGLIFLSAPILILLIASLALNRSGKPAQIQLTS